MYDDVVFKKKCGKVVRLANEDDLPLIIEAKVQLLYEFEAEKATFFFRLEEGAQKKIEQIDWKIRCELRKTMPSVRYVGFVRQGRSGAFVKAKVQYFAETKKTFRKWFDFEDELRDIARKTHLVATIRCGDIFFHDDENAFARAYVETARILGMPDSDSDSEEDVDFSELV